MLQAEAFGKFIFSFLGFMSRSVCDDFIYALVSPPAGPFLCKCHFLKPSAELEISIENKASFQPCKILDVFSVL